MTRVTTKTKTRLPAIGCPDCGGRMIARTSEQITTIVREVRLVCADHDCGASYVGQIALIRTVRRGARPNPEVRLPFFSRSMPANDDHRDPANDDIAPAAAAPPMSG